jgi:LysM repeat protein
LAVPPTSTPNAEGVIYSEVQAGDSIWSIAAKAGITLDEILEYNGLSQGDFVKVGDLLIVGFGDPPGAEEPETEATEGGETAASQPEATPTPESVTTTTETAANTEATETETETASICLTAYNDENQNGTHDADEPLRSAVAFTISDVEKVVSNYVTDGASEPFCVEGLAPGSYNITRSIATGEVTTSASDQTVSLTAGESTTLEFGSYQDGTAIAESNTANGASGSTDVDTDLSESALETEDSGGGGLGALLIIAVVVAVLLLVGVLVIILSARKATV